MNNPYLFIFTGTNGSGRKTAAHRALRDSGIIHIPSCTDRPPRDKERPDEDYRPPISKLLDEHDTKLLIHNFINISSTDSRNYNVANQNKFTYR